ncbi:7941_t:CDS:2 [Cetraspora pellucida]|uniref:7941_t:CDS:1 n=1 Tax=Cetraspora pellucida TaxID=1433469 RepID=A0A9N9DRY0_9GLOM|nr:7941_t:CDS:2 [Cetraspora pellucida]
MSSPPFSDAEESNVTPSTTSTSSIISRKKRKANAETSHSNKSYISYFFHIDKNNVELTYYKICVHNLAGSRQPPYPYTYKGGNTSNMIAYLHNKHKIIKDNYTDYLDEHNKLIDTNQVEYLPSVATDGLLCKLEANSTQADVKEDDDKIMYYVKLKEIKINDDPLEWWLKNRSSLPILAQLAHKYLSVPATSVPSERLFSDADNYILAK